MVVIVFITLGGLAVIVFIIPARLVIIVSIIARLAVIVFIIVGLAVIVFIIVLYKGIDTRSSGLLKGLGIVGDFLLERPPFIPFYI